MRNKLILERATNPQLKLKKISSESIEDTPYYFVDLNSLMTLIHLEICAKTYDVILNYD